MRRSPSLALAVALGALAACSGPAAAPDAAPDGPPIICRSPVTLGGGPWFTDVTAELWTGADPLVGNRFTLADLDGDGYPDLVTHPIAGTRPALDVEPPQPTWRVLMNVEAPGGGRELADRTVESGYGAARDGSPNRAASFAVAGDFDNDGDVDLFSGYYADFPDLGDRNELLLNDGSGRFSRVTGGALAQDDVPWHATAAAPLDFDRDGKLDVYVGFWYEVYGTLMGQQDRLYRGDGAGRFTEATAAAGLTTTVDGYAEGTNHRPTYGVTSCDLDDDGWPELLGSAYGRQWNQLWYSTAGVYQDLGRETRFAADEGLDYSDNQFYRCYCQTHPGACDPQPPAPAIACSGEYWSPGSDDQPWRLGGNTFTTACGDADGDGDLDLLNAEIKHWHIGESSDPTQLLVNVADATNAAGLRLERPGAAATGLEIPHPTVDWNEGSLMVSFLDFDLDGHLDLYLANSDYPDNTGMLFRGRGDGTFEDVTEASGLGHPCASGIAIGDLDGDGDEDLVVGSGTARDCADLWPANEVHVYRNDVGQTGNALRLRLRGAAPAAGGANRAAIGARVRVTAGGRTLRRDVEGAFGHGAIGNDLEVIVGLADACEADVEVRWPDAAGTVETFPGVLANHAVELTQGGGIRCLGP